MKTFPTIEELRDMTIKQIKSLDISDAEQESIVQTVLDEKLKDAPIPHQVFRGDIPDITTKEEEVKWQKEIDKREASQRPQDHQQETEVDLNKMPVDTNLNDTDTTDDDSDDEEDVDTDIDEKDMADEEKVPQKTEEELEAEIADLESKKAEINS